MASATEKFDININVTNKTYSLYYEICEGDEIYYNFTLVPEKDTVTAKFLLDDPWGGKKIIHSKKVFLTLIITK